jgi:hypothetical protein
MALSAMPVTQSIADFAQGRFFPTGGRFGLSAPTKVLLGIRSNAHALDFYFVLIPNDDAKSDVR